MRDFSQADQLFFVAQTAFRDRTAEVGFDRKGVLANEPPQDRPERGEVGVTPCPPPPYVSSVRRGRSERGRPCGSGRGGAALARRPIRRAAEVADPAPSTDLARAFLADLQIAKIGPRRRRTVLGVWIALADGFTELAAPARSSSGSQIVPGRAKRPGAHVAEGHPTAPLRARSHAASEASVFGPRIFSAEMRRYPADEVFGRVDGKSTESCRR